MLSRRLNNVVRKVTVLPHYGTSIPQRYLSVAVAEKLDISADDLKSFSIKGESFEGRPAYLDFQATTPLDPRVLDAMMPYLTERFGNPHSKTHAFGWESEEVL